MIRLVLLSLFCALSRAQLSEPATREFYIAAVEIGWDYIHHQDYNHQDPADAASDQRSKDASQKFIKAVYREYTDATYTVPKPRPAWTGILGPVIRAQANDRVVIHFKNRASQPFSISPVGVTYWKQSEGAGYDDWTSGQEKRDDAVPPGGYYRYVWDVHPRDGPASADPECLTYSYSSQVDPVRDFNSGLVGALLVCKAGAFTAEGQRRSVEFVLLFAVFDEAQSWYGEMGEKRLRGRKSSVRKRYHTINGYVNSTLPGLTMCQGRDHVFWHLMGMGSAPQIHSIQFQDHSLQVMAHRKVAVEMTPMTFTTAEMTPGALGRFLISCQVHAHRHAGMSALFSVEDCPKPVTLRPPDVRQVQHNDDYGDDYHDYGNGEELFSVLRPGRPRASGRSRGGAKTWVHYIAAEEVTWDYAPHLSPGDRELSPEFFPDSAERLGFRFRKVVYVEYTDISFTTRKSPSTRLLGPMLKGEVNDQFKIIFKNLASRPYNLYPSGLTSVSPLLSYHKQRDLRSVSVPPNGTFGYLWRLTPEDGPLDGDHQCLTRLYQSTLDPERDLASGLVGPLLVCKHQAINRRGKLVGPDEEKSLMFAVFDENRSWYIDENIQRYSPDPSKVDPSDPDFYSSNVMYNVNGLLFSRRRFLMCQSDVTFWHVANVGTQSRFLSVYFTGNPFQRDGVYRSVLTLFPMTGETVPMETELAGEWEISAFDGGLRSRGMTVRYTVRPCDGDEEADDDGFSDYLDRIFPKGLRSRSAAQQPHNNNNRTVAVRVCKKDASDTDRARNSTSTTSGNDTTDSANEIAGAGGGESGGVAGGGSRCEVRYVTVSEEEDEEDEQIPPEVLEQLEREGGWEASTPAPRVVDPSGGGGEEGEGEGGRQRRQAGDEQGREGGAGEAGETGQEGTEAKDKQEVDMEGEVEGGSGGGGGAEGEGGGGGTRSEEQGSGNAGMEAEAEAGNPGGGGGQGDRAAVRRSADDGSEESNDILEECGDRAESLVDPFDPFGQLAEEQKELDRNLEPPNHIQSEPQEPLFLSLPERLPTDANANANASANGTTALSLEYDDYSVDEFAETGAGLGSGSGPGSGSGSGSDGLGVRSSGGSYPSYYIAAQEVTWDYGIRKPLQLITAGEMRRGMRKFLPRYKKVVFRGYRDKDFSQPETRGELQEHLGLLGPVIRAEVNDLLTVTFKNMASRPYSLHLHGVYDRSQAGGRAGEPVPPGEVRVYTWSVSRSQGPTDAEFDCKTGAYYSTVNKERDLHSGLVGPLVVCRPGTLVLNLQPGVQEYALLFHTFDETRSWYHQENLRRYCLPPCRAAPRDPWYQTSNTFAAINGHVAETLPGLLVAQHQPMRLHLLNVGGDAEFYAVHFHGVTFSLHSKDEHRVGVVNLYPGVFGTVEALPSTPGTWLVECAVGEHQLAGMRAKLLVYNPRCVEPLGMKSGRIQDSQISASDHQDNWEPRLARLELSGSVNAWMGRSRRSWIQVDLLKPTLVHGLQTQGAKTSLGLKDYFVMHYTVSYSLDLERWTTYRGNTTKPRHMFNGNMDGSGTRENRLAPPIVARYVRIQPISTQRNPALRLELLGCDLNSCSLPLGLQRGLIPDSSLSSSSSLSSWGLSWGPNLARLNQQGRANAWRPTSNSPFEWLQVDLLRVRRVTGMVTQGAWSWRTPMAVTEFAVTMSEDGRAWASALQPGSQREKVFESSSEPNAEVLNAFDPPLFARYLRIHPHGWTNDIALRLELLGCDTQPRGP